MVLKDDMYVKCNSEDEAKEFIKIAYEQGWKWNKHDSSSTCEVTHWREAFGNHIAYHLWDDKTIGWFTLPSYADEHCFIEYSDLKNETLEQTKEIKEEVLDKKIFIINGSGGVGKDTFVKTVGKFIDVKNYSSVQPMKDAAKLLGWNGGKTEKDRKFLSDLKVLASKYNGCTYYNNILKQIQEFLNDKDNTALFIHMREPKDIDNIISTYNEVINFKGDYNPIETILVIRDSVKDIESNIADAGVNDYEYDFIIDNSGTLLELENIVIDLIEKYNLLNKTAIAYAKVSY